MSDTAAAAAAAPLLGTTAARADVGEEDLLELRLGLVMNGGVSLAVWMGGVTNEFDRARCDGRLNDTRGLYAQMLELFRSTIRIDVIAGTSAGGLNGALLGAAVASSQAATGIRDIWLELGSFDRLLRSGFDADPPSVLRGDDYFLPSLQAVFNRFCQTAAGRPRPTPEQEQRLSSEMRLVITGTDLVGQGIPHLDSFGNRLDDTEHRAHFLFTNDPGGAGGNDFAATDAGDRLGLAARTSASFPLAFEPSLNLIDGQADGRPDMAPVASFDTSRWMIDGGALDNSPFSSVLDIVFGMPADRQVRRVIAYIVPYSSTLPDTADAGSMPPLRNVLGAALNLPRDLSLSNDLIRIEEFRRRRRARIGIRDPLLRLGDDTLRPIAAQLFAVYQEQRADVSIDEVLDRVIPMNSASAKDPTPRHTNRLYVRKHQIAADIVPSGGGARGPVFPRSDPGACGEPRTDPLPTIELPWVPAAVTALDDISPGSWAWGLTSVDRGMRLLIEVAKRVLAYAGPTGDDAFREHRTKARELRASLYWELDQLTLLLGYFLETAQQSRSTSLTETAALAHAVSVYRQTVGVKPGDMLLTAATDAVSALPSLVALLGAEPDAAAHDRHREWQVLNGALTELLAGDAAAVVRSLILLEVIERASGGETEPDVAFELLRVNGERATTLRPGDHGRPEANCRLAGLQLAHFGGFYKRSWRANDWLWGRLEGAARIVEVIVDPARLSALYGRGAGEQTPQAWAKAFAGDLLEACTREGDPSYRPTVLAGVDGDPVNRLAAEISHVLTAGDGCAQLQLTRGILTRALQLEILAEELPVIADQVRIDVDRHTSPNAQGVAWRDGFPELRDGRPLTAEQAVAAFARMDIGDEKIGQELGADSLTGIVATAAAVTTNTITSSRSGLPFPLRAPVSALRGVMLALYALVRGVTLRQPGLSALLVLALAVAAMLVGFELYGNAQAAGAVTGHAAGPPTWLVAIAAAFIIAGIVTAVLRAGWWGIVIVLGILVCYLALLLTPWPGSSAHAIYERVRHEYPATTLIVSFVVLCSVLSLVQRFSWRAYARIRPPQHQARQFMNSMLGRGK
jgi:patatin-related protein